MSILTPEQIQQGLRSLVPPLPVTVVWRYADDHAPNPMVRGRIYTWEGTILKIDDARQEQPTTTTTSVTAQGSVFRTATVLYSKAATGFDTDLVTHMPRMGVQYLKIDIRTVPDVSSQAIHDQLVKQVQELGGHRTAKETALAQMQAALDPPQRVGDDFAWYEPLSWATADPDFVLLHLQVNLGVNEGSSPEKRSQFETLAALVRAVDPNDWQDPKMAEAAKRLLRSVRDKTSYELGYNMAEVRKQLANDEPDPYRRALEKAGRLTRNRGRGSGRGRGGGTKCYQCGAYGHIARSCPAISSTAGDLSKSEQSGFRGGRGGRQQ